MNDALQKSKENDVIEYKCAGGEIKVSNNNVSRVEL